MTAQASSFDGTFPHTWQAEILSARPLILPQRHFTYPRQAEEVEQGALEVLVRPSIGSSEQSSQGSPSAPEFLATCALGFRDPTVPTGLWSTPHPDHLCAVSGGYAYIIDTTDPARFTMVAFRPVLEILPAPADHLLLFIGHHAIVALGAAGHAWQSEKLSDEGLTITAIEPGILRARGWNLRTDREFLLTLDLQTGLLIPSAR